MWPQLIIVTLFAAVAQGIAGFGFTLLAVSFYLLILQSTDAVQLVLLMNFAISAVLVARLWPLVPRRAWGLLAGGGLLGLPIGLWLFARADVAAIRLAVAVVTIAFALAVLWRETASATGPPVESADENEPRLGRSMALVVGMMAGGLTSSLGAPGPPIAIYLTSLRLDKTTFRALAMSTFVVLQAATIVGQTVFIGIDARVWTTAVVLAPVAVFGGVVGHGLCRFVSEHAFRRVVLVLLLATGAYMLYAAMA